MPFNIVRGDITKMDVDAVVNAANTELKPGGGVCGAIFAAAGYAELEKACSEIGHCETGGAVITDGFRLKAKYIIHTPGPLYHGGGHNEEKLLYSCYKTSLELAESRNARSIAFPLISSGIYGYPKAEALRVATDAISDFLAHSDMDVYLAVFDKRAFEISKTLFSEVREYIDEYFEEDYESRRNDLPHILGAALGDYTLAIPTRRSFSPEVQPDMISDIDDMLKSMDKSFSEYLLELIDKSGMTDAEVYKKANIDRKLFSKIRSNPRYRPRKTTAAAFAVALELDLDGTRTLLERAGYSLSHCNKFDIILEYFITRGIYNIFEINEVLFTFDQPLMGV